MRKFFLVLWLLSNLSGAGVESQNASYKEVFRELNIVESANSLLADKNVLALKNSEYSRVIERQFAFFSILKELAVQKNLPDSMLYLALIESNLDVTATSPTKAAGIWQFTLRTGREYGLKIDEFTDERRDPVRSTEAALRLLFDLKERFGSWYLAILAYNCGRTCVANAINKSGGKRDVETLLRSDYLSDEAKHYIYKIVTAAAASKMGRFSELYYTSLETKDFAEVKTPPSTALGEIAHILGIGLGDLRLLNPQLKFDFTPPYEYFVYVPKELVREFDLRFWAFNRRGFLYERKNESLERVLAKFNLNEEELARFNTNLSSEILVIPHTKQDGEWFSKTGVKSGESVERNKSVRSIFR